MIGAWIVVGISGLLAGVFLALNIWNLATGRKWLAQRNEARAQRDRLNERNGILAGELEEALRKLRQLEEQYQALKDKDAAWYDLNEERNIQEREADHEIRTLRRTVAALKLALSKAGGEVSEHDTAPTPEPTNEAQFAYIPPDAREAPTSGKKPGRSARGKARLISGQANASGEDGAI